VRIILQLPQHAHFIPSFPLSFFVPVRQWITTIMGTRRSDMLVKVLFIGDTDAGKSSLLMRYVVPPPSTPPRSSLPRHFSVHSKPH
jgi:GTP-binding protein EngB required for normal cell division